MSINIPLLPKTAHPALQEAQLILIENNKLLDDAQEVLDELHMLLFIPWKWIKWYKLVKQHSKMMDESSANLDRVEELQTQYLIETTGV